MKKLSHWLLVLGLLLLHTAIRAQRAYNLFFEKTYLHTDRSIYLPGENIWFKAYLVNPQTGQLTGTSKTLYVELLKPNDSLLTRRIIRLNNGAGNGDFELPGTLTAGTYKLRAYTRWMQNFGDKFVYRNTIHVLDGKPGALKVQSLAKTERTNAPSPNITATDSNTIKVGLYPEGGSLVENAVGIVAVKAENRQGRGLPATGLVTNNTGDEVGRFTCDSTGIGLFTLLPLAGQTYSVKVSGGSLKPATVPVPAALKSGAVLRVAKNDSLLQVQVTMAGLQPDTSSFIVGRFAGKVMFRQPLNAAGPVSAIRIPAAQLPAGINQLTVYHQKKPYAERLVYIRPMGDSINTVNINSSKGRYALSENVTVQLQANEDANVSLAATDANAIDADNNLQTYLMLQSDIKGKIEHASRYFDRNNQQRYKQLDLLLLTQGWREYLWQRLASERIALSYLPEQGLQVRGSVTDKGGKKPDGGYTVGLYAPKAPSKKLYAATTDQNGRFVIDSVIQYGNFKVGLTPRNAAGKVAGNLNIDSARYLPQTPADDALYKNMPDISGSNQKFAETVAKRAKLTDTIKLKEVRVGANNYIRLRDITVTSFGYKDEVLTPTAADKDQNFIQWLLYHSKQAKAADDAVAFWAEGKAWQPRIIANGYEEPLNDDTEDDVKTAIYGKYNSLRMSEIDKVVIKRMLAPPSLKQVSGASGTFVNMSGNVGGITKIGSQPVFIIYLTLNSTAFRHEGDAYEFILPGYYQAKKFYSPITSGAVNDGDPRTQATLQWQPNIMLKKGVPVNVSFRNPDFAGAINISVQGLSKSGRPVSVNTRYVVQ